jgi:xylulokinase
MFLGLDIGTSSVKGLLLDDEDNVVGQATAPLKLSQPHPLWSEQNPIDWFSASLAVFRRLHRQHDRETRYVRTIGLSGQMLGVAPLDANGKALRPAMLWNDGRAGAECRDLEAAMPNFAAVTGARAMPGFSAPKILWLRRHEPYVLQGAEWLLLPKDCVRHQLTGEAVSDFADSSATLLMDTLKADWHDGILDLCGIDRGRLPRLVESAELCGTLHGEIGEEGAFGGNTQIVGGAGDNMCGAIGADVVAPGDAYISLGTSGVYCVANDKFVPALDRGMHTHRHAIPGMYLQHAVALSAAASLSWIAGIVGAGDIDALMAEVEAAALSPRQTPLFVPYLTGERTPHDDPNLTASFAGLTSAMGRLHLVQAVLEGVAFAIADCHDALRSTGVAIRQPRLIGGGTRSHLWAQLIASVIGLPVSISANAAYGPALGAARLARQARGGPLIGPKALPVTIVEPRVDLAAALHDKRQLYLKLTAQ